MTSAQRNHMGALMDWLVKVEPQIHYAQIRPMPTRIYYPPGGEQRLATKLADASITCDCSEGATLLFALAGAADPNGLGYTGAGNTQTMLDHLRHYTDPAAAKTGALVILGRSGNLAEQHVCVVRRPGKDPLLWSHGQERGPILIRLSEERKYHAGKPVTFLNVSRL